MQRSGVLGVNTFSGSRLTFIDSNALSGNRMIYWTSRHGGTRIVGGNDYAFAVRAGFTTLGIINVFQAHSREQERLARFRAVGVNVTPARSWRGWVVGAKDADFHRTTPVNDIGITFFVATLAGTVSPVGATIAQILPFLTGSITPSGIAGSRLNVALAGALEPIGDMSFSGLANQILTGVLDLSGGLAAQWIAAGRRFIVNAAVRLGYKRLNGS